MFKKKCEKIVCELIYIEIPELILLSFVCQLFNSDCLWLLILFIVACVS